VHQCSNIVKRLGRIRTESEETYPSIQAKISGIFPLPMQLPTKCMIPIVPYVVASFEICRTLLRLFPVSKAELKLLLTLTRSLGGLKVYLYNSFCIRGHGDTSTENLNLITTIKDMDPKLYHDITHCSVALGKVRWEQLFGDPYSLPQKRGPDIDSQIKDKINVVLPLFTNAASTIEDELHKDLKNLEPMCLKLAAKFREESNVAVKDRTIGRFKASSSVTRLLDTMSFTGAE